MQKAWLWVAGVFTVVLGLFGFERFRRKEAETKLNLANASKTDAVLEEKQKQLKAKHLLIIQEKEREKGRKLTTDEMEEFLKNL
jgi:hypothetical protein